MGLYFQGAKEKKMQGDGKSLDNDELLDTKTVAKRLGVTPRTVRQYIKNGLLSHIDLGSDYRVYRSDLEAFLKNSYKTGANKPPDKKDAKQPEK